MGYQTITIPSNGQGYIPSGATIVGIDNPSSLTISSGCVDLDVPDYICYAFISLTQNDSGSATEPLQHDNVTYDGLMAGGTKYTFSSPIAYDNIGDPAIGIGARIKGIPDIGNVFSDIFVSNEGDGSYGNRTYILFKTIPEIGDSLQLIARTKWNGEGANVNMPYYLPAITRADLLVMDSSAPDCASNSNPQV